MLAVKDARPRLTRALVRVKVKGNGGRVNSTGCGRKAAKLNEKARVGNVSDLL